MRGVGCEKLFKPRKGRQKTLRTIKNMSYILTNDLVETDHIAFKKKFDDYFSYLESIKEKLPQEAFDFATAPWRYDFNDHRCPKDAWVEYLNITELSSGERRQNREIEIRARLLGAYQDGYLDLIYKGVKSYTLSSNSIWHRDWHRDEIRLSEKIWFCMRWNLLAETVGKLFVRALRANGFLLITIKF